MKECIECYAINNRATPLLGKRECLETHEQYICGTCGRCICCQKDNKRQLRRIDFPFKSVEIAQLYLRVADYLQEASCGIYEIISESGRKFYKIFADDKAFSDYLTKNKKKHADQPQALYRRSAHQAFPKTEVRMLTPKEIEAYLSE